MVRAFAFLYGIVAYIVFFVTFLYSIGFVGNIVVPRSIDIGAVVPLFEALFINALLLGVFSIQHSVMARRGFKKWWTKIVPESIERSTYVLLSSGALGLLFWQWRPITNVVWDVSGGAVGALLMVLFWIGCALVLLSTFMINHFDLFGLRQVYLNLKRERYTNLPFQTSYMYKFVRHPLLLGFIIAFWATPLMTVGHLIFAIATTTYMVFAIQLEEKDMVGAFGQTYEKYQSEVPMLIPTGKKSSNEGIAEPIGLDAAVE